MLIILKKMTAVDGFRLTSVMKVKLALPIVAATRTNLPRTLSGKE